MTLAAMIAADYGTIGDILRERARENPERLAVVMETGEAVTYAQFDALADRVAAALQRDGIQPGEAVAVCALSSIPYAALFLGALRGRRHEVRSRCWRAVSVCLGRRLAVVVFIGREGERLRSWMRRRGCGRLRGGARRLLLCPGCLLLCTPCHLLGMRMVRGLLGSLLLELALSCLGDCRRDCCILRQRCLLHRRR